MMKKNPEWIDSYIAHDLVTALTKNLYELESGNPLLLPTNGNAEKSKGGFADLLTSKIIPSSHFEEAIRREIEGIDIALQKNKTIANLTGSEEYKKLAKSLAYQAKKSPKSLFGKASSKYLLLKATLISLGKYKRLISGNATVKQMSAKDWEDAIRAINTLRRLEKNNGLYLYRAFEDTTNLPWNWLDMLEQRVSEAKENAPKPHNDKYIHQRLATRLFTEWLLRYFDHAPVSMVEKFTHIINYETTSVSRLVPTWTTAYRTDPLT